MGRWAKVPYVLVNETERIEFDSFTDAVKYLNVPQSTLCTACKTKRPCKGYMVYKSTEDISSDDVQAALYKSGRSIKHTKPAKYALRRDGEIITFKTQQEVADFIGCSAVNVKDALKNGYFIHGDCEILPISAIDQDTGRIRHIWNVLRYKHIAVCPEWETDCDSFETWALNNGYKNSLYLCKHDAELPHSPTNSFWGTLREKRSRSKICRYVTIGDKTNTLAEWSRITNIPYQTICNRYQYGDRGERLIRPLGTWSKTSTSGDESNVSDAKSIYATDTKQVNTLYTSWLVSKEAPEVYRCKHCGFICTKGFNDILKTFRFCPSCGTDMK